MNETANKLRAKITMNCIESFLCFMSSVFNSLPYLLVDVDSLVNS